MTAKKEAKIERSFLQVPAHGDSRGNENISKGISDPCRSQLSLTKERKSTDYGCNFREVLEEVPLSFDNHFLTN